MENEKKKEKKNQAKKKYEKPSIVYEEKIEALAGACGAQSFEKGSIGEENPGYGSPCLQVHS